MLPHRNNVGARLVRRKFEQMLNAAITVGRHPSSESLLGTATVRAIRVIAMEHPEATPTHISAAHDAFNHEHVAQTRSNDTPIGGDRAKHTLHGPRAMVAPRVALLRQQDQ